MHTREPGASKKGFFAKGGLAAAKLEGGGPDASTHYLRFTARTQISFRGVLRERLDSLLSCSNIMYDVAMGLSTKNFTRHPGVAAWGEHCILHIVKTILHIVLCSCCNLILHIALLLHFYYFSIDISVMASVL